MNEEDALADWLPEYLEADTTLMALLNGAEGQAVFETGAVPLAARGPFVRYDRLDGDDLMVVGLSRVWVDSTWHVRGCVKWEGRGRPDRSEINAIGARLDALLHDYTTTTATHQIESFREDPEPIPVVEEQNGERWLQSGGIYRIRAAAIG